MNFEIVSENELKSFIKENNSVMLKEDAELLLSEIKEIRIKGGNPLCFSRKDGSCFILDNG